MRAAVFLVMVALIVGMAGCLPAVRYNLTISSTEGGQVTTPGEGTFAYDEGTVVDLIAQAEEGYQFVKWTGSVSAIVDVHDATTSISMNGNYSITANFATVAEIWDWSDLDAIRNNLTGAYILMNDLDSTTAGYEELAGPTANVGKGWQAIGTQDNPFTGVFDGQGHEIRELFVNRPTEESFAGLFGYVDVGGSIKNLVVINVSVTGNIGVGGLVGMNFGTVRDCYSTGSISGYDVVGGLVGLNVGIISYCNCTGSVTGTGSAREVTGVGGLVGMNYGYITHCHSTGIAAGEGCVGGLMGFNYFGTVSDSYSSASATGNSGIGGLVGTNGLGTVSNSYATGSVTGNLSVGGLMGGNAYGNVVNSYATGSVTGNEYVGGLVGGNVYNSTVSNSYSTGSVTGTSHVGGLVGWIRDSATVSNSYSAGTVTGDVSVGGLVGLNEGTGPVSNSFWDTQISGQATSDGGTGKNTTEMQDIATFSGAGWNITAVADSSTRDPAYIWNIVNNVTYPFLSWQA